MKFEHSVRAVLARSMLLLSFCLLTTQPVIGNAAHTHARTQRQSCTSEEGAV